MVANNSRSTSAPSVSPKVQNNAVPSVSAEPAKSDEGAVSQKTTAEVADNSNDIQAYSQDDGIAIASIDVQSDDRSVYDGTADNINNSRTVKSSVEDDYSLAGGAKSHTADTISWIKTAIRLKPKKKINLSVQS